VTRRVRHFAEGPARLLKLAAREIFSTVEKLNCGKAQLWKRPVLRIKTDVYDVAVLDDIVFAFEAAGGGAGFPVGAYLQKFLI